MASGHVMGEGRTVVEREERRVSRQGRASRQVACHEEMGRLSAMEGGACGGEVGYRLTLQRRPLLGHGQGHPLLGQLGSGLVQLEAAGLLGLLRPALDIQPETAAFDTWRVAIRKQQAGQVI